MQTMVEDFGAVSSDDETAEAFQAQMEELAELREHPIDLNTCSRDELLHLSFLADTEIDALLDYRALHGPLHSLGELRLIPQLSAMHMRWLQQFVVAIDTAHPNQDVRNDHGRHDVMTRIDIPLYERDGWSWQRGIANRWRYTGQWGRRWGIGMRAEKDAGEPIFTRQNPFYDAWGGYAMMKDWKMVRTLIAGDYKASFGEGLIMNNGFQLSKQTTALWRRTAPLRPHRSMEESRFLRGVAATIGIAQHLSLTALYSYRSLDAVVQPDNTVRSIIATGLHRTSSELSHKATLGSHTTAVHAAWQHSGWQVGGTALYQRYDHEFRQGASLYRQIYPVGYQFGAFGVDYGAHTTHLFATGETAYSRSALGGGWATLNKFAWRFDANTQVVLVQRFYAKNYLAPHAQAFAENSRVQNESGVCLLFDAERLGPFSLHTLLDWFYHPWPRYTMSRSSQGCEAMAALTWQPSRASRWLLRYSLKNKEQSDVRHHNHRLRLTYSLQCTSQWTVAATVLGNHYTEPRTSQHNTSNGIALVPKVDYRSRGGRWHCSLQGAWFSTHDYNSRLYAYDQSLAQSFGWTMMSGRGERVSAIVRWQNRQSNRRLPFRWQWQLKAGVTHYRDRSTISTGPELISSPLKADVNLLLRMRF